jgi:L-amino acid N-acyltransferase YncA
VIKYSLLITDAELRDFCRFKRVDCENLSAIRELFAGRIIVVARWHARTIGSTSIYPMWKSKGIEETFSGSTGVHPLARGIGVGTAMLRLSLEEAKSRGCLPVFGSIDHDNTHSLAMCSKVGFRIVDRSNMTKIIEKSFREYNGNTKRQIIVMYDGR